VLFVNAINSLNLPPEKDNMLETLLGSEVFNGAPPKASSSNTPHVLRIHRQAVQLCNFATGHLPENPVRTENVHRAQNIFRLRALLLPSLQEVGEWENLVEGIELGINPPPSPTGPSPRNTTFDDLLFQAHRSVKATSNDTPPRDETVDGTFPAVADKHGVDLLRSPGSSERKVLQPAPLLFPAEVLRLPSMLWPSTHGCLPRVAVSSAPGNLLDGFLMERVKALTNSATSRLLRMWAKAVQGFLEAQSSASGGQAGPAPVPCSAFQATQSLVLLAEYLALALYPTAASYNDVGILLSSLDVQSGASQPSGSGPAGAVTGHSFSKVYFEAALEMDPRNAHLLTNLGSYWKKERNYDEAIRFVSPSPWVP
jgi:hypothetical protein